MWMLQGHIVMHITLLIGSQWIETHAYEEDYHDPEKDAAFITMRKYFVDNELFIFKFLKWSHFVTALLQLGAMIFSYYNVKFWSTICDVSATFSYLMPMMYLQMIYHSNKL